MDLLNPAPKKQDTSKPLGHLSPSMMAADLHAINAHLTTMGAPILNGQSTQLGDIRARCFWLAVSVDHRPLRQNERES